MKTSTKTSIRKWLVSIAFVMIASFSVAFWQLFFSARPPLTTDPATLAWLGSVAGHRTVPLGVEHFGQIGTVSDLYRHFGIDTDAILTAVDGLTPGRRVVGL